ncbi:MAG: MarR family transcriptional regulator [Hyphomicrobiales bacterium]|nr:MAG: MarR family transcriptional regulator [Hyphomicrobiales bacterium]
MAVPKSARKAPPAAEAPAAPDHAADTQGAIAAAHAPYRLEAQIGFVLRCVHQRATEIFNATMARHGVTPTQFSVLVKLDDLGSVSQNQLGRLVAMDPATTSGVVGRLVARGLVAHSPAPEDARLVLLALTPEGRKAVADMKIDAAEVTRRTLEPLSAEEATALLNALGKLT